MSRRFFRRSAIVFTGFAVVYLVACAAFAIANPDQVLRLQDAAARAAHILPHGFLLGTATAAHQVEGGNTLNDWATFEHEGHLAATSGRADDEWNRVPQDVALMHNLGANAYRFSIEWSRLEPQQGAWNEADWAHYSDEISKLRAAGITPMVTLLHFTLPEWLAQRGGLLAPDFPQDFARFAAEAARRLSPQVNLWCTINEPNTEMALGYLDGRWPPNEQNPQHAVEAMVAMLRAHAAAAAELHHLAPGSQVGIAVNQIIADPASRWNLLDWMAAYRARTAFDWSFYDAIQSGRAQLWIPGLPNLDEPIEGLKGSADFYGVNYYTRFLLHFSPTAPVMLEPEPGPGPESDVNWEIYPDGMLRILRLVWDRYHLPIYITENGIADHDGSRRGSFIEDHLEAVTEAAGEGIPVRGYFYWSLLDNYEWSEGYKPRFGLYSVDYSTEARTPAPGSEVFRKWAQSLASK
jgi:beta-glucosidase